MLYHDFLTRVIDESEIAFLDYCSRDNGLPASYYTGALAGLCACRHKSPPELGFLLEKAHKVQRQAHNQTHYGRYLWIIGYLHEIAWICDVVSVVMISMGISPLLNPSARAIELAKKITLANQPNN